MAHLRSLPLHVLAVALLFSTAAMSQIAAPAVRIVNPVDESQLVTLKGNVHPLANARNDRGAAPAGLQLQRMHLVLQRSSSQEAALRQFIGDAHTPGTASYHKWLTPDQFGQQFGPSDQDIATVESWLTSHGFSVTKVNPGRQTIEFSGSASQLSSAFHTQIHKYVVNGETHYANSTNPQIPAALAPVVGGFVSLNNFRVKRQSHVLGKATYDPKTEKATPQWTIGSSSAGYNFVLAPQDFYVQYDLNKLYSAGINGTGQTIAVVNDSNINVALANQFRTLFSLPANPPQVIIDGNDPGVDGINNPDGPNYDSVEAYLDVEWSGAVAPNANVDLVVAADTEMEAGLVLAAEHAIYGNVAPIISLSFGACESSLGTAENAFLNSLWEQAAAQGITVLVSSGDNGSAGCDNDNSQEYAVNGQAVSGFASTPYNVAVGGTDFFYSDYAGSQTAINNQLATYWNTTPSNNTPTVSIKGVIPEQPWNSSQYGLNILNQYTLSGDTSTSMAGGSGGASIVYTTKPTWQTGTGVPADSVRDLPDVSLFASSGANASYYPECYQDGDCQPVSSSGTVQFTGIGGTSASAPAFAGIMALVNQQYGRQGQANYVLYPLATQFPAAFNDVTAGTNSEPCDITDKTANCIAVSNPITVTVTDSNGNSSNITEGQIGTGTTADYNATTGYDLATGLGSVDAYNLVTDWNKVSLKGTATTLVPSSTSFAHGTAITVNGTVTTASGTPSGAVALMTDSSEQVQQGQTLFNLSSGTYSGTISTLPGGNYNIWAQYGGDSANGLSTSTKVPITVSPEASGIYFQAIAPSGAIKAGTTQSGTIDYGTQLVLSAQVAPSSQLSALESCTTSCPVFTTPTGTVAFQDGTTALNTAILNAEGDAEYNAPFTVGTHSVTASYAGDNSYNKSTAAAIAFTVAQDTPVIAVSASNQATSTQYIGGTNQATVVNVQVENNAIASNATSSSIYPVSVAPPTGTITVSGFPSGVPTTATLAAAVDPSTGAPEGVATFTIPASTSTQNLTIAVSYPGDTNYTSLSNQKFSVQIAPLTGGLVSTTAATVTGSTISPTTSITISGTVTGQSGKAAPTGGVYIYSSGYYSNEVSLTTPASGDVSTFTVTLNSQTLFQGANFVTLQYSGDNTYYPSAYTLASPVSSPLSDFTLIPQTTIVPVTAGSSGTDTINLASVNGFSGNVTLTCTAAPGISCSIPSPAALTSGSSATAALTLNAETDTANQSYNVLITGTDSTGAYVHTLAVQAVVTGSAAGSQSYALSANPASISVVPGATSGNTSTIAVTPLGGFSGTVAMSCAVTTSPANATSPATCSLASPSASISGTTAASDVLTVATTSTTTAGAYAVTVTGTSNGLTLTTVVPVNVGTFTLSSDPKTLTLSAGATTGNTSTISVTPSGPFTGAVALSCSVASPSGANDPATCGLSQSSVTLSGTTAQTVTVTVSTTATTTSMNQTRKLFWPSAGGAVLALVFLFGIPKRRRNWLAMVGLLALVVSIAGMGCGGGGGGSNNNTTPVTTPGTTAGTYTVTVTGVSGSITQTATVVVTVN